MLSFRRATDRTCTRMFSRSSRPTPRTKHRRFLQVEPLEQRVVLSTYWVSPSGSDSNNGSATSPYATLQHSMMSLQPGDTLDVEPGTYAGFIVGWDSTPANSGDPYGTIDGTAGQPITIQSDPSAAPGSVIINSRNGETPCGIDLEPGCDYITIKGLTVTDGNGSISDYGIKVAQSNYVNILNNTVYGVGKTGIFTSFASDGSIQNNLSYNNGEHGIYASNSPSNVQILNNICHDNSNGGIQVNADASQGGPGTAQNLTIANNVIYNNGTTGGGALNFDGLQNSQVYNNLLYNNHNNGLVLYDGDASAGSVDNVIANNTIVQAAGAAYALNNNTNSYGNVFYNNVILGTMYVDSGSIPAAWSNNILLSGYTTGGGNAYTFPAGIESTASALFANAGANNYQLSSTSPAVGAGTATDAPGTDILGNPRPSSNGYDIGAYEYQAGAQSPPPVTQSPPPVTQSPPPVTQSPPPVTQGSSIWSSSASPQNANENDNQPVEVGVRFSSDVDGYVTGLKFNKGSGNTGTHIGHLWDSAGNLLATATFTGETAAGWQQVNFSTPVAITAGTTYVASYLAPNGHYADDQNYFTSQYNSGSLHVPANGGVYAYGGAGSFPTQAWNASNYWVDVVFSTQSQNATPTTAAAGPNATIWANTSVPTVASENDSSSVQVGVKFSSDVNGYITGLRFYKASANTGTHVGNLWTSTGTLLATATFTGETATGWQQVNFSTPVAITAGTTYVASYLAPNGYYADDQNYFTSQYNSGSLHVPANGGVYAYGGAGSFPTQVWNASNYWVDVVFTTAL